MLLGSVGQKAEVADAHKAIGEHMEEEAADELLGIERHRFQPVFVSVTAKGGLDPLSSREIGWRGSMCGFIVAYVR